MVAWSAGQVRGDDSAFLPTAARCDLALNRGAAGPAALSDDTMTYTGGMSDCRCLYPDVVQALAVMESGDG